MEAVRSTKYFQRRQTVHTNFSLSYYKDVNLETERN